MKKTLFLLVALCLTIALADARTVRKVYEIDDFTALNVTNAFEVTLEHADEFRVEIEISEEFLPYLLVKNRGGVLELNFTRLPFRLKQKARSRIAQATVRMPVVTDITLSGASKLSCNDQFSNTMNRFSIDLRGAARSRTSMSRPRKSPSNWPAPPRPWSASGRATWTSTCPALPNWKWKATPRNSM